MWQTTNKTKIQKIRRYNEKINYVSGYSNLRNTDNRQNLCADFGNKLCTGGKLCT